MEMSPAIPIVLPTVLPTVPTLPVVVPSVMKKSRVAGKKRERPTTTISEKKVKPGNIKRPTIATLPSATHHNVIASLDENVKDIEIEIPAARTWTMKQIDCAHQQISSVGFMIPTYGQVGPAWRWVKRAMSVIPQKERKKFEHIRSLNMCASYINPLWNPCSATREFLQNWLDGCKQIALELGLHRMQVHPVPIGGEHNLTKQRPHCHINDTRWFVCVGYGTDDDSTMSSTSSKQAHTQQLPVLLGTVTYERLSGSSSSTCPVHDCVSASSVPTSEYSSTSLCSCLWRLVMENEGVKLDTSIFCLGKSSKQSSSRRSQQQEMARGTELDGPIGHFGEGLKMASLLLCARGATVTYFTNEQLWMLPTRAVYNHDHALMARISFPRFKEARERLKSLQEDSHKIRDSRGVIIDLRKTRVECLRVVLNRIPPDSVRWDDFLSFKYHSGTTPMVRIALLSVTAPHSSLRTAPSRMDGMEILTDAVEVGCVYHRGSFIERVDVLPFGLNVLSDLRGMGRDRKQLPSEFHDMRKFVSQVLARYCDTQLYQPVPLNPSRAAWRAFLWKYLGEENADDTAIGKAAADIPNYSATPALTTLAAYMWEIAVEHQTQLLSSNGGVCFPVLQPVHASSKNEDLQSVARSRQFARECGLDIQRDCFVVSPLLYHIVLTGGVLTQYQERQKQFQAAMIQRPLVDHAWNKEQITMLQTIEWQLSISTQRKIVVDVVEAESLRLVQPNQLQGASLLHTKITLSADHTQARLRILDTVLLFPTLLHVSLKECGHTICSVENSCCKCLLNYLQKVLVDAWQLDWQWVTRNITAGQYPSMDVDHNNTRSAPFTPSSSNDVITEPTTPNNIQFVAPDITCEPPLASYLVDDVLAVGLVSAMGTTLCSSETIRKTWHEKSVPYRTVPVHFVDTIDDLHNVSADATRDTPPPNYRAFTLTVRLSEDLRGKDNDVMECTYSLPIAAFGCSTVRGNVVIHGLNLGQVVIEQHPTTCFLKFRTTQTDWKQCITVRYSLWCPCAYFKPTIPKTSISLSTPDHQLSTSTYSTATAATAATTGQQGLRLWAERLLWHVFGSSDRQTFAGNATLLVTLEQVAQRLSHTRQTDSASDIPPFAVTELLSRELRKVSDTLISQQRACGFRSIAFCTLASLLFQTECVILSNFVHSFVAIRRKNVVGGDAEWMALDLNGLPAEFVGPNADQWLDQSRRVNVELSLPSITLPSASTSSPSFSPPPSCPTVPDLPLLNCQTVQAHLHTCLNCKQH